TARSRSRVASPNALAASAPAVAKTSASPSGLATGRIPRPPPPEAALINTGYPTTTASRSAVSTSARGPEPGTTETSAATAVPRASALSPMPAITTAGGPTNARPRSSLARATAACPATWHARMIRSAISPRSATRTRRSSFTGPSFPPSPSSVAVPVLTVHALPGSVPELGDVLADGHLVTVLDQEPGDRAGLIGLDLVEVLQHLDQGDRLPRLDGVALLHVGRLLG